MCTKVLVPYIHKLENPALFTAQGCEYLLLIVTPTVYPRLVVNYNFNYFFPITAVDPFLESQNQA